MLKFNFCNLESSSVIIYNYYALLPEYYFYKLLKQNAYV